MFKRLHNLIAAPSAKTPAVEQRAAFLAGKHITYTLKRSSRRRSIGLRIDDKGLTVSMPLRTPEKWLDSVLQERADWVVGKLEGWQARRPQQINWIDGEHIPYLGELVRLRVMPGSRAPAQQYGDELHIRGDAAAIERRVSAWYRHQAMTLFSPREIKLSNAKTRWGSCTSRGVVRLNLQLIKLPQYLIDYVVVHELSHLHEMNHSAAFWRVVGSVCPDYVRLRSELKAVGL
jgi:predicted metal-dependent hydrolase